MAKPINYTDILETGDSDHIPCSGKLGSCHTIENGVLNGKTD